MITSINEFKKYLLNENKQQIDLNILQNQLEKFRKDQEEIFDQNDYKDCFKGSCQDVTDDLENYLIDLGYDNVKRVRGYYKNASPEFEPNMENQDQEDKEKFNKQQSYNGDSSEGLKFPHQQIELDKYIIDLTEDQFHPGEENEYKIGLYKKPNEYYKKI